MARMKRKVTEYEEDEPTRETREIISPLDPDEETYTAFMAKWGREGAKVRVYRVTPQGKQYCFLAAPDEVDPEAIRLFHAKQSYAHETGQYLIEVEVNGEVRPPFPILIAPQVGAPGMPETSAGMSGPMGEMFRMLQAQNERLEARLTAQQTAATKEPIGELADALLKLDQLRGGGSKELPLDTLIKAIQLGKEMGGNGDSWLGLVREALPALAPAVASLATSIAGRAQAPAPANQNGGEEMNEEAMIKVGLAYLKKKALAGSDPDLYVDIVVDNQTEAPYGQLIRRILDNDFSAFAAVDPEISKPEYEPFFRRIYNGIRSIFIEQNTVVIDPAGKSGNDSNTGADEDARKPRDKKSKL